jgi:hypothetical protein
MKKENIPLICNAASILLMIGFIAKTIVDYANYSSSLNSAPFSVWILVNALTFVIPAVIIFIVGIVCKKKNKKRN